MMIAIGNFFFRWRNTVFPVFVLGLFAFARPVQEFFGSETLEGVKDGIALLLALSGLALRATVIGFAYIKRGGLNKKVYADQLVTEGLFSLCRNPLYVGNMLVICGLFLMHGNLWVMAVGILTYAFIYQCIILAEEHYLRQKFGAAYDRYCAETPRWWVRFSGFRKAVEGMAFNFRKVLAKDYTTMATAIAGLAAVEFYEYWRGAIVGYEAFLAAVIVACAVFVLATRFIKKRGLLGSV